MSDTSTTPSQNAVEATTQVNTSAAAPVQKKSGGSSPIVLILGIVLVVCLLVMCCGGIFFALNAAANSASNSIGNSLTDLSNQGIERAIEEAIKSEGGTDTDISFGTNAKLPDNFPSDVPVYQPSRVLTAFATKENDKTNFSATLTVLNTNLDNVSNFYRSEMAKNGWDITTESDFFLRSFIAEKGERQLTVSFLDTQDAETGVSVIISSTNN